MTVPYYSSFVPQITHKVQSIVAADPAHDFAHIQRVVNMATQLAQVENACLDVVIPAAWLHDCVAVAKDSPMRSQASTLAADYAINFLADIGYDSQYFDAIAHAIAAHSYSAQITPKTLEAQVVQDADRMDALGAIGIARCMLVGGSIGRELYHHGDLLAIDRTPDDYNFTIDHFFTKLLNIGDTMHTAAAKREAKRRTDYMYSYLKELENDVSAHNIFCHKVGA